MFKLGLDFTEIQALFRNVNWIFNINTKNLHLRNTRFESCVVLAHCQKGKMFSSLN